ncbi:MmgE/PrpD family protein [Devosia sp.]|uniref:MmgE/PrpD family protein n=1 Tax=Devosia sp. TaxID=1871048 RepID=UPI002AFEAB4B|nr:MmgE/PrpD family protein [Devosia sp.]
MSEKTAISYEEASRPIMELARWTLETDPAWNEPRIAAQIKLLILDALGVAIAARDAESSVRVGELIDELGGNPRCTVIGRKDKTSLLSAILMNGTQVRALDFNDVQYFIKEGKLSVAGHCSDNMPVVLACAEYLDAAGSRTMEAIAMAYEMFGRLRTLMPFVSPWDGTSVSGLIAAAIYGRLAGFDLVTQANALAMGAMRCSTPSIVRWGKLSEVKNLANALIAQSAVQTAMLAERGVTGPLEVLNDRGGLHQVFDPTLDFERLWAPVSEPPFIMTSNIKPYACIGTAQAAVEAALNLHTRIKDRLGEITRIVVTMADLPMIRKQQAEIHRQYPRSREAADHSFTFLPAVAMVEGALGDHQYRDRRWEHEDIVRLIELTQMEVSEDLARRAPGAMPARIAVTLADGTVLTEECLFDSGHSFPDRGLSPDAVISKFTTITAPFISQDRSQRIRAAVENFETTEIASLMALLQ